MLDIEIFRIAAKGDTLDIVAHCKPYERIANIDIIRDNGTEKVSYSLEQSLIQYFVDNKIYNYSLSIPLDLFEGSDEPAIYTGVFKVTKTNDYEECEDCPDGEFSDYEDYAYASNVSMFFSPLVDQILSTDGICAKVSDDAVRSYLLLFAHLTAMSQGDYDKAVLTLKILAKNFSSCGGYVPACPSGNWNTNCGCNPLPVKKGCCFPSKPVNSLVKKCNCGK